MAIHSDEIRFPASYRKGHPDPRRFREGSVELSGPWRFLFDPEGKGRYLGYEKGLGDKAREITVPFPYQCERSGINLPGYDCPVVWYEKDLELSPDSDRLITFYGVDYKSEVYWNGSLVGLHEGGYDAFSVHIPASEIKEGVNRLVLRVEDGNRPDEMRGKQKWRRENFACYYTETTGIVRPVLLEKVGPSFISSFSFVAEASGHLRFEYEVGGDEARSVRLSLLDHDGGAVLSADGKASDGSIEADVRDVIPWSPDNPYLYDVRIELISKSGDVVDTVLSYCGFASFAAKDGRIYMNGKDLYLKMVLDQDYHERSLTSPTEGEYLADLDAIVDYGFNGIRKHETIPCPLYSFYVDAMGLLITCEIPSPLAYSLHGAKAYEPQMRAIIKGMRSHPSVIAYLCFNESWGVNEVSYSKEEQNFVKAMYLEAKSLVGSRFVIGNDGWEQVVTDILSFHNYASSRDDLERTAGAMIDGMKKGENPPVVGVATKIFAGDYRYEGQPIVLSEFAGIAFQREAGDDGSWGYGDAVKGEEEYLTRYEDELRFLHERPEIRGFCLTQISDVQQEKNGLLSYSREVKVDPKRIKKLHDAF